MKQKKKHTDLILPLVLCICFGLVIGLCSAYYSSTFGLPSDPNGTVVQYPVAVNAIFFGIAASCFAMIGMCPLWVKQVPLKKQRFLLPMALQSALTLLSMIAWMIAYPKNAVLASQIFTPVFFFCLGLLNYFANKLDDDIVFGLVLFATIWLQILVFVTFQNTTTNSLTSQPVTFESSVTIEGPLYVTGANSTSWSNFTAFASQGYDFATSSVLLPDAVTTTQFTFVPQYLLSGVSEANRFSTAVNSANPDRTPGMWTDSTFLTEVVATEAILFQNSHLALTNVTKMVFTIPTTNNTIIAGGATVQFNIVSLAHTTFVNYRFQKTLPLSLFPSVSTENETLVLKIFNSAVSPQPVFLGDLSMTVVTTDYISESPQLLCKLLDCRAWCSTTDLGNSCFYLGCCH